MQEPNRKLLSPIETIIYNIDKGLRSLGHKSIVACSADSCITGEQYVTIRQSFGDYVCKNTMEQKTAVKIHLLKALERARRGDIDIIQMHGWLDYIYNGVFNPDLPIVMTLHVPAKDTWIRKTSINGLTSCRIHPCISWQ